MGSRTLVFGRGETPTCPKYGCGDLRDATPTLCTATNRKTKVLISIEKLISIENIVFGFSRIENFASGRFAQCGCRGGPVTGLGGTPRAASCVGGVTGGTGGQTFALSGVRPLHY